MFLQPAEKAASVVPGATTYGTLYTWIIMTWPAAEDESAEQPKAKEGRSVGESAESSQRPQTGESFLFPFAKAADD